MQNKFSLIPDEISDLIFTHIEDIPMINQSLLVCKSWHGFFKHKLANYHSFNETLNLLKDYESIIFVENGFKILEELLEKALQLISFFPKKEQFHKKLFMVVKVLEDKVWKAYCSFNLERETDYERLRIDPENLTDYLVQKFGIPGYFKCCPIDEISLIPEAYAAREGSNDRYHALVDALVLQAVLRDRNPHEALIIIDWINTMMSELSSCSITFKFEANNLLLICAKNSNQIMIDELYQGVQAHVEQHYFDTIDGDYQEVLLIMSTNLQSYQPGLT